VQEITRQRELVFPTLPSFWISPTTVTSWVLGRKSTRVHRRRERSSSRWCHLGRGCLLAHPHHHRRRSRSAVGIKHSRNRPLRGRRT
jgi:hypothetical protein